MRVFAFLIISAFLATSYADSNTSSMVETKKEESLLDSTKRHLSDAGDVVGSILSVLSHVARVGENVVVIKDGGKAPKELREIDLFESTTYRDRIEALEKKNNERKSSAQ